MLHRSSLLWIWIFGVSPWIVDAAEPVDFNRDIRPLISSNCIACHGPDEAERAAGLRLDTEAGAHEDLGGYAAIVPHDAKASEMIVRLTTDDPDMAMPPAGKGRRLTTDEVDLVRRWIDQGGRYDKHWSYQVPTRPALPTVKEKSWARNPIDRFVLAQLESMSLSPSPPADRLTMARRVSIDLTGLPPTWAAAHEFANDPSDHAYETYVERLLASPAFGERWARVWLDLARYADSAGYADDPPRTIWPYRDYVIDSLNANKPFDQFTIEQIAGDLLDNPSDEQLIATAFHRNTTTNSEGGTNDEEFRNAAVVDRVNTTMAVWMGTTMACAQCHTHKFDPITHHDYFSMFAFFNQTADADRRDESPLLQLWNEEQVALRQDLARQINDLKSIANQPGESDPDESVDDTAKQTDEKRKALEKKLRSMKPAASVPVMKSIAETARRETFVQIRGNYQSQGDQVFARTPEVFHPLPDFKDANPETAVTTPDGASPDRLALARWLIDEANPLTARVVANRHWEQIFGLGIVETSEEFGSQGELPSHPELLDWLAVELRDGGWDLKQLLRLMVTSATYRQSSAVTSAQVDADPNNRWLARGPRFRISAEMVRDQALFVSGLLCDTMGGPPVQPPQPNLGLKAAFGGGTDWTTSGGEDRFRRGIYTMWRRSSPYPSMAQFDAPNREVCTVRRSRTNTPLQALVTLNDPVYVEAAQSLARRVIASASSDQDRIAEAFHRCLIREPSDGELKRVTALLSQVRSFYEHHPELALPMATDPIGDLPPGADAAQHAAWTVLANVILNLDEMLMKP